MAGRLSQALDAGFVELPETARIVVFGGGADETLSALPAGRTDVVQPFYPDHAAIGRAGYTAVPAPRGPYGLAVVRLPRARDLGRAWIAAARAATDGPIVVDGAKTDGVESALKALRRRADVGPALSKSHGKLFVVTGGFFDDWADAEREVDGYVTRPGVFSADGIDRGSALLADALPRDLKGRVADFGAGWGYLARRMLASEAIETLDLIEADARALDCARRNVTDPRARFHWADATTFVPESPYDVIVMNPPFHAGRRGDPALGAAFIEAAARCLARHGTLWLVANRHLPYESTLAARFGEVETRGGDAGYKIICARRPGRARRS